MGKDIYQFGTHHFSSKEKVKKHAADIREKYPAYATIDKPDDLAFLMDLLRSHVEFKSKVGSGIKRIYQAKAPDYPTHCFYIERMDNSRAKWGIDACIESIEKLNVESLRTLTRPDVDAYKRKKIAECATTFISEFSGKTFSIDQLDVDHITPFEEIIAQFCQQENVDITAKLFTQTVDIISKPVWIDSAFATRFTKFHRPFPLQLVSSKENRSDLKILRKLLS